jgi:WD40-like Beta Propeller Repeat
MNFLNDRLARSVMWVSLASLLLGIPVVIAQHFSDWEDPENAESIPGTNSLLNTPFNDGCPIQAPDGLSLYIASNRPGSLGGQDIWVAHRETTDDPWGLPEHLPEPVNSSVDDFCPTPVQGHGLFFVSRRYIPGVSCGTATTNDTDIYFTRLRSGEWQEPQNLGCQINSSAEEWSPSLFEGEDGQVYLYFASTRVGGPGGAANDADIYFSANFGPAQLVSGLNTEYNDHRPNVRKDGREIVFDSNRPGNLGPVTTSDIWTAKRDRIYDDWLDPIHLPAPINTSATESRASLSWDGLTMYFGSNRPGSELNPNGTCCSTDIYVTRRQKLKGHEFNSK